GQDLGQSLNAESFLESTDDTHRLMLGPFTDFTLTQQILDQVKLAGHESAFIRKRAITR
ncbi:SPOR domain-containing protein, partial [Vibrio vulnificus]|nr:SPOR domain-containing protein [Vibrio vulnificus]